MFIDVFSKMQTDIKYISDDSILSGKKKLT